NTCVTDTNTCACPQEGTDHCSTLNGNCVTADQCPPCPSNQTLCEDGLTCAGDIGGCPCLDPDNSGNTKRCTDGACINPNSCCSGESSCDDGNGGSMCVAGCCTGQRQCGDGSCVDANSCCGDERSCSDGSCVGSGSCCNDEQSCDDGNGGTYCSQSCY